MFDPGAIGTTILWLESERRQESEVELRESEVERRGPAVPIEERRTSRGLSRSLARWLRSAADRLEPTGSTDVRPA